MRNSGNCCNALFRDNSYQINIYINDPIPELIFVYERHILNLKLRSLEKPLIEDEALFDL